jgi:ferredoxin/flavodoxin---NADP+ reductase
VVIIGNGNVAFDVARVLTTDPDALARTDIADHALAALRNSRVAEVVIAARRGPADSAFTLPELIGLTSTCEVVLESADRDLVLRDLAESSDSLTRNKLEILSKLGDALTPVTQPRVRLAYQLTPKRILGDERTAGVEFAVTGTNEQRQLSAGVVLTSIGYRGKPIRDLPFDESAGVVPNDGGRVIDPSSGETVRGTYVAGWIKRGPTGFIGTNKSCAAQTVHHLVADYNDGLLADAVGRPAALDELVHSRRADVVDAAGWKPSTPRKSPALATTGRATSSPRSPRCWRRRRPRRHLGCGSACWPGCGGSSTAGERGAPLGSEDMDLRTKRYHMRHHVLKRSITDAPVLVWLLGLRSMSSIPPRVVAQR